MAERVWSEKDLVRRANRRLAVLRHVEVSDNVAATCRYYGISRAVFYRWKRRLGRRGPGRVEGSLERSAALPDHHRSRGGGKERIRLMVSIPSSRSGECGATESAEVDGERVIVHWLVDQYIRKGPGNTANHEHPVACAKRSRTPSVPYPLWTFAQHSRQETDPHG